MFRKSVKKIKVSSESHKIKGTSREEISTYIIISLSFILINKTNNVMQLGAIVFIILLG